MGLVLVRRHRSRLSWEHDGVDVARFGLVADGVTSIDLGLPTPTVTDGVQTYTVPLPELAPGEHTLAVVAVSGDGLASEQSAAVTVTTGARGRVL